MTEIYTPTAPEPSPQSQERIEAVAAARRALRLGAHVVSAAEVRMISRQLLRALALPE